MDTIRKITDNDKAAYISMVNEFYSTDAVMEPIPLSRIENTFNELMTSETYATAYIIESDGQAAGYALLAKTFSQEAGGIVMWIEELYVQPRFRGKGLGNLFLDFADKMDAARWRLEVEEYNKGAVSLYKKHGYSFMPYSAMFKQNLKNDG